ncbi:MAG: glutaminyl-peptide cyclotransferase [Crocinitomicaceae bacterium]|jgi:glutamine cyclotransferase
MKKILIILVLVGLLASYLVPMFLSNSDVSESPFTFGFQDNLAIKYGQVVNVPIEVNGDVKELTITLNGKILQKFKHPKEKLTISLDSKKYQIGAYELELQGYDMQGQLFTELRNVRILSDVTPERWTIEIIERYPHNQASFTQGLAFSGDQLFEGTGDPNENGATLVGKVDLKTGQMGTKIGLDASHFGEGITILGNELFQLTWKNQKCMVYDKETMKNIRELSYTTEGWGICTDGNVLFMSDGSERIYIRNPKNFQIIKTLEVYTNELPVDRLNELEYVDGLIYANIWTSNEVAVIDPQTGKVIAIIDATNLVNEGKGNGEVLNGIAYQPKTKKLYMTGKFWPTLFEVKVRKN